MASFLIPSTKGELKPFADGKHDSLNMFDHSMLCNKEINENVLSFLILFYAKTYSMHIDYSSINYYFMPFGNLRLCYELPDGDLLT